MCTFIDCRMNLYRCWSIGDKLTMLSDNIESILQSLGRNDTKIKLRVNGKKTFLTS